MIWHNRFAARIVRRAKSCDILKSNTLWPPFVDWNFRRSVVCLLILQIHVSQLLRCWYGHPVRVKILQFAWCHHITNETEKNLYTQNYIEDLQNTANEHSGLHNLYFDSANDCSHAYVLSTWMISFTKFIRRSVCLAERYFAGIFPIYTENSNKAFCFQYNKIVILLLISLLWKWTHFESSRSGRFRDKWNIRRLQFQLGPFQNDSPQQDKPYDKSRHNKSAECWFPNGLYTKRTTTQSIVLPRMPADCCHRSR